jgi:hypothetical protein
VLTAVTLPENLADYTPPESNLIPERDNGVHGEVPLMDTQLDQLRRLMRDGEAVHVCEGVCDPR